MGGIVSYENGVKIVWAGLIQRCSHASNPHNTRGSLIGPCLTAFVFSVTVQSPPLLFLPASQNIRTYGSLCRTMEYLLGVMGSEEAELVAVHEFLWDRFREVREGGAGGRQWGA